MKKKSHEGKQINTGKVSLLYIKKKKNQTFQLFINTSKKFKNTMNR